jgi:flagellar motility protein MotE (MotC chaperone)
MLAAPWFIALVALVVNAVATGLLLKPVLDEAKQQAAHTAQVADVKAAEEKKEEAEKAAAAVPPPPPWNFKTDAVDELINELKASKEGLLEEMKDLSVLQMQIAAERQEVEKLKAEVVRLRSELDSRVLEVQEYEKDNIKKLVNAYSKMPPESAVPILFELDEDTVVKIMSMMRPDAVSNLLGRMALLVDKSGKGSSGLPDGLAVKEESPARRAASISDKLRLFKASKKEVTQ